MAGTLLTKPSEHTKQQIQCPACQVLKTQNLLASNFLLALRAMLINYGESLHISKTQNLENCPGIVNEYSPVCAMAYSRRR